MQLLVFVEQKSVSTIRYSKIGRECIVEANEIIQRIMWFNTQARGI